MTELVVPKLPAIGQTLLNGAVCVDVAADRRGNAWVLAVRTDMAGDERVVDKWVTWEIDHKGHTYLGHYFDDLATALQDLSERSGRR